MPNFDQKKVYDALALPNEAIANGGIEILRAGLIDKKLYVSARHVFKDPAQWGEVLADITRRLGLLYSVETDFSEKEVLAAIESAFAAELGAKPVKGPSKPTPRKARKALGKQKTVKRRPRRVFKRKKLRRR